MNASDELDKNGAVAPFNGVEIGKPDLIQKIKHLVIDESGMLVNPDLLQSETHHPFANRSQVISKKSTVQSRANKENKSKIKRVRTKTIDNIYLEKEEWLKKVFQQDKMYSVQETANNFKQQNLISCPFCKTLVKPKRLSRHVAKTHRNIVLSNEQIYQLDNGKTDDVNVQQKPNTRISGQRQIQVNTPKSSRQSFDEEISEVNLVKCPLCKHRTQYNVLFVHIQVSHPEKNPKIVMAEFNIEYRRKKEEEKIDKELNGLVKDYEKLKQSHDESRDGGKYLGYMSRENGKFGSLPLYDDYSDESNSE